jgi:hypothetical protein
LTLTPGILPSFHNLHVLSRGNNTGVAKLPP